MSHNPKHHCGPTQRDAPPPNPSRKKCPTAAQAELHTFSLIKNLINWLGIGLTMSQESLRRWIGDGLPLCGCFVLIREEMNYESKEDSGSEKIHPGPPRVWLEDSQLAIAAQSE